MKIPSVPMVLVGETNARNDFVVFFGGPEFNLIFLGSGTSLSTNYGYSIEEIPNANFDGSIESGTSILVG